MSRQRGKASTCRRRTWRVRRGGDRGSARGPAPTPAADFDDETPEGCCRSSFVAGLLAAARRVRVALAHPVHVHLGERRCPYPAGTADGYRSHADERLDTPSAPVVGATRCPAVDTARPLRPSEDHQPARSRAIGTQTGVGVGRTGAILAGWALAPRPLLARWADLPALAWLAANRFGGAIARIPVFGRLCAAIGSLGTLVVLAGARAGPGLRRPRPHGGVDGPPMLATTKPLGPPRGVRRRAARRRGRLRRAARRGGRRERGGRRRRVAPRSQGVAGQRAGDVRAAGGGHDRRQPVRAALRRGEGAAPGMWLGSRQRRHPHGGLAAGGQDRRLSGRDRAGPAVAGHADRNGVAVVARARDDRVAAMYEVLEFDEVASAGGRVLLRVPCQDRRPTRSSVTLAAGSRGARRPGRVRRVS